MKLPIPTAATLLALTLLAATPAARAVVLYDAAAGTLPSAQGWFTSSTAGAVAGSQSVAGGVLTIDSTGAGVVAFGNARFSPVALDATSGYAVDFLLKLLSESHASANRAGFSLLLVGSNPAQSVELSFWDDRVWVPSFDAADPDRFVQGAGAAFDTTAAMTDYRLVVQGGGYSLSAGGQALFSGTLQNYAAGGSPYNMANVVFFGDNSSRGSAAVALGAVSVSAVPEPGTWALMLAGLGAVAGAGRFRRRA